jgi:hypothetical protein
VEKHPARPSTWPMATSPLVSADSSYVPKKRNAGSGKNGLPNATESMTSSLWIRPANGGSISWIGRPAGPVKAAALCETRGSHRAFVGGLGEGLAGKSATQRASQIAAGGFPIVIYCQRGIKLKCHPGLKQWFFHSPCVFLLLNSGRSLETEPKQI